MSKEVKKIGSNINLKGLVIHQVTKSAGLRTANTKLAKGVITIEDKERAFISKIYKAYFDNSKPLYGIFAEENPTFKNCLTNYINENDFFSFSKEAVKHYEATIKSTIAATGGFVVFGHFENTDKKFDYVLVMTLTNKDGFVVSESDLTLKDIKNLDLSKIDVACMINLTKWQALTKNNDAESKTYLSFSKGNKDVSYYFLSFIDCDNKTTATESTNRLLKALEDYCTECNYNKDTKVKKRNDVYSYCTECIDNNREIQLSAISSILDPEDPENFQKFAADDKYSVSPIINGDRKKLRSIKFISYKDKKMTIEFDAVLLKEEQVVFNKQKRQLTFKNLPDKLMEQIPS